MNIKELEKTLWATAKKLRNNMDTLEHMHIVLGLIFLKYLTEALNRLHEKVARSEDNYAVPNAATSDGSLSPNVFDIPERAQWHFLQDNSRQQNIGTLIDNAVGTIEKINADLKGILPDTYAKMGLDRVVLGELVSLIGDISQKRHGHQKKYLPGHLYEYLLTNFAEAEGKTAGHFYTPPGVAKLVAEMIEPYKGKIYDGCCGMGEMLLQCEKFIQEHHSKTGNQLFYGQDINETAIKLARMNLAVHGIDAALQAGNTFTDDNHPSLEADFILAHPPFNTRYWRGVNLDNEKDWKYGVPPEGNANYAWLQHFISKLSPKGTAGIVLPDNSLYSSAGNEREIRKNIIEDRLIDCIVALPPGLFYDADIPGCIWVLSRNKTNNRYTNADNEILFIDAGKLGEKVSRRSRALTNEDISLISKTYHRWRNINGDYIDIKGFCRAVSIERVRRNGYLLMPKRYTAGRGAKKVTLAFLSIILLILFCFSIFKNNSFTLKPGTRDTAITVQSIPVEATAKPAKKINKPATKKVQEDAGKVKDTIAEVKDTIVEVNDVAVKPAEDSFLNALKNHPVEINPPAAKTPPRRERSPVVRDTPDETTDSPATASYKVISKAYFYNEPDESTRRGAFINHWNNTYASIKASDEKNGFIYVVFTNHLNQTSRGWLRKKDLREVNQ